VTVNVATEAGGVKGRQYLARFFAKRGAGTMLAALTDLSPYDNLKLSKSTTDTGKANVIT
jgi:hypothetical protein